jgi:hypothetical protein
VVIFFTRRVDTPLWSTDGALYHLHQRQNQCLLRPLIALKETRLKGALSIARHFQFDRPDARGELPLVRSVAVTLAGVGALIRLGAEVIGHLRLQNLVEDRLKESRKSAVSVQQVLDLLVVDANLKSGHR